MITQNRHIVNTYNLLVVVFVALGTLSTAYGLAIIGSTVGQPSCRLHVNEEVSSNTKTDYYSLHVLQFSTTGTARLRPHHEHHRSVERSQLRWGHNRMSHQRLVSGCLR